MGKWEIFNFDDVITDSTKNGMKIKKEDYLEYGQYPIIDQGQNQIAGYSNTEKGVFSDVPAIIFGDHTRVIKYVETPFFLGADGVKLLKCKKQDVDYRYLYFFFVKNEVVNTGYNRHFKWLKELKIPLPPLEVQRKIAETLDAASELLAIRKNQLAELDKLIQSVFFDMFGNLGHYAKKTLVDIILVNAGLSYGIVQPGDDKIDGIGIIRPVDIKNNELSLSNIKHIPKEIEVPYKKTRLNGNELLITVRGTTGDSALTDYHCKGMNVTRGIAVIRQDDTIVNRIYLHEYLKTDKSQRYIQENTYGATLKQINLSSLRKLEIHLPPLPLQTQFSETVQKIEEQKALVQKAIDETQALFDSLMNEYFE